MVNRKIALRNQLLSENYIQQKLDGNDDIVNSLSHSFGIKPQAIYRVLNKHREQHPDQWEKIRDYRRNKKSDLVGDDYLTQWIASRGKEEEKRPGIFARFLKWLTW